MHVCGTVYTFEGGVLMCTAYVLRSWKADNRSQNRTVHVSSHIICQEQGKKGAHGEREGGTTHSTANPPGLLLRTPWLITPTHQSPIHPLHKDPCPATLIS